MRVVGRSIHHRLRARWRFVWIVTSGFRFEIVVAVLVIVLAGTCIHLWHPGDPAPHRPSYMKALHCALALLTLQQELPYPELEVPTLEIRILQFLWFALPVVGVTVVAETLVRLGVTIFNREQGREEWQVAVAGTMRDHIVVIGFGRIGYRVVGQLAPRDSRIVVVESEPREEFKPILERYEVPLLLGDARREDVLEKTGIRHARAVLVLTNNDLVNIEVALNARELNPSIKVIVRMFDDRLATRLERAFDFQAVLSTTALAAPSFAAAVWNQKILHSMNVGNEDLHLARFEVASGSPLIGLTIAQVEARHSVNVLLHQREGQKDLLPAAGNVIGPHEAIYVVGKLEGIDDFDRVAGGVRIRRTGRLRRAVLEDEDARAVLGRKLEAYYDELGDGLARGDRYQTRAKARALALLDVRPGHRVLEVGIGTGSLLETLATRTADAAKVVGIDVAENLLRRARERLGARCPALARGSAIRLPFRDECFDRVASTYVLDLLDEEDVLVALSEMRRVVRPGGLVACAGLTARGVSPKARLVAAAYALGRRIDPLWTGGCRPLDLEPLARRAGLRIVTREVVEQRGRASEVICCAR